METEMKTFLRLNELITNERTTCRCGKLILKNDFVKCFQFFFQRMDFRIDIGRNFEALNQFLQCKKCKKCKKFMFLVVHPTVTRNEFASTNNTTIWATPFIGGGFIG